MTASLQERLDDLIVEVESIADEVELGVEPDTYAAIVASVRRMGENLIRLESDLAGQKAPDPSEQGEVVERIRRVGVGLRRIETAVS